MADATAAGAGLGEAAATAFSATIEEAGSTTGIGFGAVWLAATAVGETTDLVAGEIGFAATGASILAVGAIASGKVLGSVLAAI